MIKSKAYLLLLCFLLYCLPTYLNAAGLSCSTIQVAANSEEFRGISGSSNNNIIAVGHKKPAKFYHYNGSAWSIHSNTSDKELHDVSIVNANLAFAVGHKGRIMKFNGTNWSQFSSPSNKDLSAVWAHSSSDLWIVGKKSTLYHWNGSSWNNHSGSSRANIGNNTELSDAWSNSNSFYTVTKDGDLYRYNKSPQTWNKLSACNNSFNMEAKSIWSDGAGKIYIAGQNKGSNPKRATVFLYTEATNNCSIIASSTTADKLEAIYGYQDTVYAVGKKGLVLNNSSGSWSQSTQGTKDLKAVWVSSDGTAYYAGKNGYITTCKSSSPVIQLNLSLDESSWNGTIGEIIDSSGKSNHGVAVGSANTISNGKICRAGNIPLNTSDATKDAIDTSIDIDDDIGNSGTISFWYKSNNNWNGGGDRALFDASPDNLSPITANKFFLLQLKNNGALQFGLEDSNENDFIFSTSSQSFFAGEWVYITATWDMSANRQLYIDGSLVRTDTRNTSGQFGELTTLYMGDNRSDYHFSGTSNSANGVIDEVRIYKGVQTSAQIQTDMNATHPCANIPPPSPLAEYYFDETLWNGASNEVVDNSGKAHHGVAVGAADTISNGKICRAGNIPLNTSDAVIDAINTSIDVDDDIGNTGTISFWYKSNNNWNGGGDRALFDASPDNLSPTYLNNFFHLKLKNNGAIQFSFEDSSDANITVTTSRQSFVADEWVYITSTWDISSVRQIYINGNLANSNSDSTSGHIGEWATLYIGDNRSDYHFSGTSNSANGVIDEVRIYREVQTSAQIQTDMNATHPCSEPDGIDHFEFSYFSNALTCTPSSIIVKACANSDCTSPHTDDVSLSLSPSSGWPSNPTTISNGTATLDFSHTTVETITLAVSSSSSPAANALQCIKDSISDPSCSLTFADAGFVFDVPTLTACKPSANVTLRAVKKSDTAVQCIGALTGTHAIKFGSTYNSPLSGTKAVKINGSTITSASSGTAINLSFNVNGEADFIAQYDDAGQIQLNASYTKTSQALTFNGNDTFVSTPVKLAVYTNAANADCNSSDASCSSFQKAGEDFNLNVKAACWVSDDDTDFTDNPTTPNFLLNSIAVNHTLIAPASANLGSLAVANFNFTAGDHGNHTISQSVSEVGVFKFDVNIPNYLGETITSAASDNIGRFYPDHLKAATVADGSFSDSCSGFTYSGQTLYYDDHPQLTVTAYNAASPAAITQNYRGDFAKLAISSFSLTPPTTDSAQLGANNTNLVRLDWSPATATLVDNTNGSLSLTLGNDSYNYRHEANSLIAAFANNVDLSFTAITDSDGVATQDLPYTLKPNGTSIRFGRLSINSAHGSELLPLSLPIKTQYFNGFNWTDNSSDNCTVVNLNSDINLSNPSTSGGSWLAAATTMTITDGVSSASLAPLASGQAIITFSQPGEDNQGYIDIRSNITSSYPWLLGDFDNDGSYDDNANGRASFGLFKGSDNMIFRQELY